jgi:hypothetical protein
MTQRDLDLEGGFERSKPLPTEIKLLNNDLADHACTSVRLAVIVVFTSRRTGKIIVE